MTFREMERQRQLEWERQKSQELQAQRQKEQDILLKLKAKNHLDHRTWNSRKYIKRIYI